MNSPNTQTTPAPNVFVHVWRTFIARRWFIYTSVGSVGGVALTALGEVTVSKVVPNAEWWALQITAAVLCPPLTCITLYVLAVLIVATAREIKP